MRYQAMNSCVYNEVVLLHVVPGAGQLDHRELLLVGLDRRVDEFFEARFEREVFGGEELRGAARTRDGVFDDLDDAARIRAHDDDAVGEVGGLLEIVRDGGRAGW